jgi:hypothetical protein
MSDLPSASPASGRKLQRHLIHYRHRFSMKLLEWRASYPIGFYTCRTHKEAWVRYRPIHHCRAPAKRAALFRRILEDINNLPLVP